MMRWAACSCANRIIDRPPLKYDIFWRAPVNDAVGPAIVRLPHHWHAFRASGIVLGKHFDTF